MTTRLVMSRGWGGSATWRREKKGARGFLPRAERAASGKRDEREAPGCRPRPRSLGRARISGWDRPFLLPRFSRPAKASHSNAKSHSWNDRSVGSVGRKRLAGKVGASTSDQWLDFRPRSVRPPWGTPPTGFCANLNPRNSLRPGCRGRVPGTPSRDPAPPPPPRFTCPPQRAPLSEEEDSSEKRCRQN